MQQGVKVSPTLAYSISRDPHLSFRAKSRNLGPVGYRKGDDLMRFGV
jgi:hypothetical protein